MLDSDKFKGKFVPLDGDNCWEWQGYKRPDGYGEFNSGQYGKQLAHRLSWELFVGPIPKGMSILHGCDNKGCVNPKHLYPGTQADNIRDMLRAGRQIKAQPLHRKLFDKDVVMVRKLLRAGWSHKLIGRLFKVSATTIHYVRVNPDFPTREVANVS